MDCIFCKIVHKKVPADILLEDNDVMVFKDSHPKAPVHFLVVPKEHIQSIAHLKENHAEVIAKIIYRAKEVAEKFGLEGYKLVFNVGLSGGQTVDHLHLHCIGGWGKSENGNAAIADL